MVENHHSKACGAQEFPLHDCFKVAVIGEFQEGKSTLVNALLKASGTSRGGMAATGTGAKRVTCEVSAYPLNNSSVALLDTPGYNPPDNDHDDTEALLRGCRQADAVLFMLTDSEISDKGREILRRATDGGKKPFSFVVNPWNKAGLFPKKMVQSSAAALSQAGMHPILFGSGNKAQAPVVNALKRSRGEADGDEEGWRRLCYLLGIGQPGKSPLEKIAVLHDRILKTTG